MLQGLDPFVIWGLKHGRLFDACERRLVTRDTFSKSWLYIPYCLLLSVSDCREDSGLMVPQNARPFSLWNVIVMGRGFSACLRLGTIGAAEAAESVAGPSRWASDTAIKSTRHYPLNYM